LEALLPNVIDSTLQIVLDAQGPSRQFADYRQQQNITKDEQLLSNLPGDFQLLMDERTGFFYH
jgi:hypothetical protein